MSDCEAGQNSNTWLFVRVPGKAFGQTYAPGECTMVCPSESHPEPRIVCHSCCADLVYDGFKDGTAPCDAAYLGRGCWRPFDGEWKKDHTELAAQAPQPGGALQEPLWRSGQAAPVSFQAFAQKFPPK